MASSEERKYDALDCQKDQDDLAMFELTSSPLIREGNRLIDTDCRLISNPCNSHGYGDCDSDDSDVIYMGTNADISSKNCESCRTSKCTVSTHPINMATGPTKHDRPIPSSYFPKSKRRMKPYYDRVFEGCNSAEPIEINDESVENAGDCKSTIEIAVNSRRSFPSSNNGTVFAEMEPTTPVKTPKLSSSNIKSKSNQFWVKKGGKGKKRNQRKTRALDDVYISPWEEKPSVNTIDTPITFHPSRSATTASILDCSSTIHSSSLNCTVDSVMPLDSSYTNVESSKREKKCTQNIEVINLCEQPPGVEKSTDKDDRNPKAKRDGFTIIQKSAQNYHEDILSTQTNQLVGKTSYNVDTFDVSQANSISALTRKEVHQYKGKSTFELGKNKRSSHHENNSHMYDERKKQGQKNKGDNTSGGMSLRKKSIVTEVSKSGTIYSRRNEATKSRRESAESGVKCLSKSASNGKADLSFSYERCGETRDFPCSCNTQAQSIQIIDDDIEYIDVQSQSDARFNYESNCETNREEPYCKTKIKPRFKPYRNKKLRKNERELSDPDKKAVISTKSYDFFTFKRNSAFKRSNLQFLSWSNNNQNLSQRTLSECSSCDDVPRSDGDKTKTSPNSSQSGTDIPSPKNSFIFYPSNSKPNDDDSKNFLGMNVEDALKEQELLLQKAAARVRNQPVFRIQTECSRPRNMVGSVRFSTIVRNVHLEYSNHWKLCDFYSRLGLPIHANEEMIKSQYRRLARIYHPDRNIGKPDTKHKFQAVTEAYINLMNV